MHGGSLVVGVGDVGLMNYRVVYKCLRGKAQGEQGSHVVRWLCYRLKSLEFFSFNNDFQKFKKSYIYGWEEGGLNHI